MDMFNHTFTLFPNGSLVFDENNDSNQQHRRLHLPGEYCVAFDGVSEDGTRLQGEYIRNDDRVVSFWPS